MESNLNEVLGIAFYAQEQEEEKSRQIEDLIKSYKGASALLPPRQYGKPLNPEKFGITLRSIIEKNNPQFEIRGSLIELLNSLVSKKLNKNLIFGNSELAIVFVNIILKSNIDVIYLIDKYFGNTSAVFAYSVLKLFKSSDNEEKGRFFPLSGLENFDTASLF